jgi:hypothetical protein
MDKRKSAMFRKSIALLSFAFLLSLQPVGMSTAFADDPVPLTDLSPGAELAFWNKIKESADISDFATYLQNFPNGMFYDPALEKFQGLGGNLSDLRNVSVAVPAEQPAKAKPVTPVRKVVKTTSKKVYKRSTRRVATKRITRPVCPVTKRLVGNSCQVVVRKVKVAKPKPVRVAKRVPKKKFDPSIRKEGAGGGGGGGTGNGGGW